MFTEDRAFEMPYLESRGFPGRYQGWNIAAMPSIWLYGPRVNFINTFRYFNLRRANGNQPAANPVTWIPRDQMVSGSSKQFAKNSATKGSDQHRNWKKHRCRIPLYRQHNAKKATSMVKRLNLSRKKD